MSQPWICPKCGRVYGPSIVQCLECNSKAAGQERRPDGGTHYDYPDRPDRLR